MKLSVIIPAYNEEKHIRRTVESIYRYLLAKGMEHEILVVPDGAHDGTKEIVRSMKDSIPTLELLDYKKNRGKGYAVKTGMLKASGDFRLFTDADNSTTIDHVEKMMPFFNQGYEVVIGSIAIKGAKVASGSEPFWRRLFGKMGNLFIQIMAVPGISDTQRGFKIVTAKAAQDIFPRIRMERFSFDIEMLLLARKLGYKIKEVPINWNNDMSGSKVKLNTYFNVLMDTVKIRWNSIIGKYK